MNTANYNVIFPFNAATYAFLERRLPASICRILDLGCGTGQYTGRFADQGHETLGIDLDSSMVAAASKQHPSASFRVLDMMNLDQLPNRFHMVYSTGNVMSYLPPDVLALFLSALRNRLLSGGVWIFQTVNWDRRLADKDYSFPVVQRPDQGLVFRRSYEPAQAGKVRFSLNLEHYGKTVFQETHTLYPRLSDEVSAAHHAAGFTLVEHAGDFTGARFDPSSSPACIRVFTR